MDDTGDLARLRRWEDAGGHWQVLARTAYDVTLALTTCDGGEEMDRLTSAEPALLAHVADRDADV